MVPFFYYIELFKVELWYVSLTSMLVNCCLARDFEILWINDFDASVLRFFKILFGVALQNYLCT